MLKSSVHFRRSFMALVLCMTALLAQAQTPSVSGKWYGVGTPAVDNPSNAYLIELILEQKGTVVTGYLNYYFRNGYFSNRIKGNFTARNRQLQLQFIPLLYFQSLNVATGVDCMMETRLTLTVNKIESVLQGIMNSDNDHRFTCATINLRLVKQLKETTLEEFAETVEPPVAPAPVPLTPAQVQQKTTEQMFTRRTQELTQILDFDDDSVRVELYDNGEFDGDSISVFYNGKLQVLRQELNTRTPIAFYVQLQANDSLNTLSMMAENLGTIPPNAALMVLRDGNHRYEVPLSSNYQKNAAVRLRKKPKKGLRQM